MDTSPYPFGVCTNSVEQGSIVKINTVKNILILNVCEILKEKKSSSKRKNIICHKNVVCLLKCTMYFS